MTGKEPSASPVGRELGGYRVLSRLGGGGMGVVYLAEVLRPRHGLEPGARVALKVVHSDVRDDAGVERLRREAETGGQIVHPNVVRTYGAESIEEDGASFDAIVMEYVEGETLADKIRGSKRLREGLCRQIGLDVARGLAAIHAAGVIHRDLKPENVMVTRDDVVKVMDLGLACLADRAMRRSAATGFVGSTFYAAPEQFDSEGVDARADLFALGLVLYEASTGLHPFADQSLQRYLHRLVHATPRPASEVNPDLTLFFGEVVRTLSEKDRDARFATAEEAVRVLAEGERSEWWRRREADVRARVTRPARRIRLDRHTGLYGREEETASLRAAFEGVRRGRGCTVLLHGEAGVGKSRLVDEFVEGLRRNGEEVHFLFGSYPPSAASARGAFATAFREHFGEEGLEQALSTPLAATPLLVPAFAALLREAVPPTTAESLTPESLRTLFVRLTRSLAAERPTVLLIDDIQFAPEEGRSLFAALALAISDDRVLLIGTSRRELRDAWVPDLQQRGRAVRIELKRLGSGALARLLVEAFGSEEMAAEHGFQLVAKSDGNPYFVFELLRELVEKRQLERGADGRWIARAGRLEISVPSTIAALVAGRLRVLDPKDRRLLNVAACYGHEFDPRLVGDVVKLSPIRVLERLGAIEESTNLVRAAALNFEFDHHLIQESIYGGLGEALRKEYHGEIGEALVRREPSPAAVEGPTAVRICEHLLQGGRGARTKPYLLPALDYLRKRYLNEAALSLARRALDEPGMLRGTHRFEVLLLRASNLEILGRTSEEQEALDEALGLATAEGGCREAAHVAGDAAPHDVFLSYATKDSTTALAARQELERQGIRCFMAERDGVTATEWRPRIGKAIRASKALVLVHSSHANRSKFVRREVGVADTHGIPVWTLRVENVEPGNGLELAIDRLHFLDAWTRPLEPHLDRLAQGLRTVLPNAARAAAGAGAYVSLPARAQIARAWLFLRTGKSAEAVRALQDARTAAQREGDTRAEWTAKSGLGVAYAKSGLLAEARAFYEECLAHFRGRQERRSEAVTLGGLGNLHQATGSYGEAEKAHAEAVRIFQEVGDRWKEAVATGNLGTAACAQGLYERALAYCQRHLELSRQIGFRQGEAIALVNRGGLCAALGRFAPGAADLESARALSREVASPAGEASAIEALAGAVAAAGDRVRAKGLYTEALGIRTGLNDLAGAALASACLGGVLAAQGATDEARLRLREAVDLGRPERSPSAVVLAGAYRAFYLGEDPGRALEDFTELGGRLLALERLEAAFLLSRALSDAALLDTARRTLDDLVSSAPAADRATMVEAVPLYRDVRAAVASAR